MSPVPVLFRQESSCHSQSGNLEGGMEKQESEWCEDLQLWTYKVPIKTLTWEQVHERIEESFMRHEREAQKKRGAAKELDVPVAAEGGQCGERVKVGGCGAEKADA